MKPEMLLCEKCGEKVEIRKVYNTVKYVLTIRKLCIHCGYVISSATYRSKPKSYRYKSPYKDMGETGAFVRKR